MKWDDDDPRERMTDEELRKHYARLRIRSLPPPAKDVAAAKRRTKRSA